MKKWGLAVAPAIVIIVGLWFVPTAPARGIVYWANYDSSTLSYASLGSGTDGQLRTGAANLVYPLGEALDPATGQIYWANDKGGTGTGSIAWANPNYNDLGGNLTITGARWTTRGDSPSILPPARCTGPTRRTTRSPTPTSTAAARPT